MPRKAAKSAPAATLTFQPISTAAITIPALEWSPTLLDGRYVTHAAAEKACTALGDGWRLPTIDELLTLVDRSRHNPAVDTVRFPDTQSGYYWTSSEYAPNPDCTWVVGFGSGSVDAYPRDGSGGYVRAVRSACARQ